MKPLDERLMRNLTMQVSGCHNLNFLHDPGVTNTRPSTHTPSWWSPTQVRERTHTHTHTHTHTPSHTHTLTHTPVGLRGLPSRGERGGCRVTAARPAHRDEEWSPLATTRESPRTETKTQHTSITPPKTQCSCNTISSQLHCVFGGVMEV